MIIPPCYCDQQYDTELLRIIHFLQCTNLVDTNHRVDACRKKIQEAVALHLSLINKARPPGMRMKIATIPDICRIAMEIMQREGISC